MIIINKFSETQKIVSGDDITIDMILDADVTEEFYSLHGLDEEEYPMEAWSLWLTQDNEDRENREVWVYLCHGGESTDFMTEEQIQKTIQYVKEHGLDIEYGLLL